MTKRNNKKYEFFDSLAHTWAQLLTKIHDPRKLLPWIRHRLSPQMNSHAVQLSKKNVETCARHCGARVIFAQLPLKNYITSLRKFRDSPDAIVTLLTYTRAPRQAPGASQNLQGGADLSMTWQKYGSDPNTWSPYP